MSRTYPRPSWEDERHAREASKRASTLVRIGAVAPESFCLGKQAYGSRNDARCAAKHVLREKGRSMHAYACPFCGSHHLATTEL